MEGVPSILKELSTTRLHVEEIQGSHESDKIRAVDLELKALYSRIVQEDAFQYLDDYSRIQELFQQRSVAPPSRIVGRAATTSPSETSLVSRQKASPEKLPGKLILGHVNQYDDGRHPVGTFSSTYRVACPSTTVAFMSHFLNHGSAGLDGDKIDQLIRVGQDRFLPMIKERESSIQGILEAKVPEKRKLREALPAFLEGHLKGVTKWDGPKSIQAYGGFFEIDLLSPAPNYKLRLRDKREVVATFEGTDLRDASNLFADRILAYTREKVKQSTPELRGKLMAPVDMEPAYQDHLGAKPVAPEAFFLDRAAPRQGEAHRLQIRAMLARLENLAERSPHQRIAATVTINGQILGVGIEKKGAKTEVVLFDSHGKTRLHERSEGYAYTTESLDDAAAILIQMMSVKDFEIEAKGLTREEIAMIASDQKDLNEVGLWVVAPKEVTVPFS
ncbi:MAG: hypothetical protein H7A38_03365 [Chlamydiales bacterium]|nr:hypothetical protein [Chlamydiales bacterium]